MFDVAAKHDDIVLLMYHFCYSVNVVQN